MYFILFKPLLYKSILISILYESLAGEGFDPSTFGL